MDFEDNFEKKAGKYINTFENKKITYFSEKKIIRLKLLIKYVSNYTPKSKIKKEKDSILKYLSLLTNIDDSQNFKKKDYAHFETIYLSSSVNKLHKFGFRFKYGWVLVLILILFIDSFFIYLIDIYNIPIASIIFFIEQLRRDFKAYEENKLW